MLDLSNFLTKYRRFIKDGADLKQIVLEILKENSIPLTNEDIKIQGDNLYLKCSPVLRSEIFLRKERVLESINSKQRQYKFKDIKF